FFSVVIVDGRFVIFAVCLFAGECNLFEGRWVRGETPLLYYTNRTCRTIPFLRNCFLHGREDTEFLRWRWKPENCELPRFSPERFFEIFRGKTVAFIGDSLARNQVDSLLCMLSEVSGRRKTEASGEDPSAKWEFSSRNVTLLLLRSQFLVAASEIFVNGTSTGGFRLHLDKLDAGWSEKLPTIDYAVFSDAHWFFRRNYLYQHGNLIGCVYCRDPNVTDLGPGFAIRRAFRAALDAVRDSDRSIFAAVRTYSPSHFENGTWNTGGVCDRTAPTPVEETRRRATDREYRRIQVEEAAAAAAEVVDVTEMMTTRGDGHPGVHWGNRWMKGYSDCIHWCLPGPIDAWNELLLEVVRR
ncbi:hypothetical protein M569_14465, partial [Genlisea aurea]